MGKSFGENKIRKKNQYGFDFQLALEMNLNFQIWEAYYIYFFQFITTR